MGLRKTQAFMRQGVYLKDAETEIKNIDIQLATIVDLQKQLTVAINDLTEYSAMHRIADKCVSAYVFIRTFLDLRQGYKLMKSTNAVNVVSKNGYRATVLKNSSDLIKRVSKIESFGNAIKEGGKVIRNWEGANIRNILSSESVKDITNSSELALYFDAFNSGQGALNALYEMDEELDRQYDELILKKRALKWND